MSLRQRPEGIDPLVVELRRRREDMRMTQRELADRMGTWPTLISEWERGTQTVTLISLQAWCAALGLELVVRRKSKGGDK